MRKGLEKPIINWEYLGALLAEESDVEQVEFFKAFIAECRSFGTNNQAEMQLFTINKKLTDDEKDLIRCLGEV